MNPKRGLDHILLSAFFAVFLLTAGCDPSPIPTDADYYHDSGISASQMQQQNQEAYARLCGDLQLPRIEKSLADAQAVSEYRVTDASWMLGYNYYDLQVLKDGTGKFTCILYRYVSGKVVLNVSKDLTVEETKNLMDTLNTNRFWSIPEVDPTLKMGCDGMTVFIEGYKDKQRHFAGWWCPDDNTEPYNIDMTFKMFADTFAKEPAATGS